MDGDGSEKKDGIGVQQWFTIHDHYIKWLTENYMVILGFHKMAYRKLHSKHGHYIKQRTGPSVVPCCGGCCGQPLKSALKSAFQLDDFR